MKKSTGNESKTSEKGNIQRPNKSGTSGRKPIGGTRDTEDKQEKNFVVRILGVGQFLITGETVRQLNVLDNEIVRDIRKSDEEELRKRLEEMISIVTREHQPLDSKEIISSDFIIPNTHITIEEAKEWFEGEGLVPEGLV